MAGFDCSLACSRQLGQQSGEDYSSGRGKNSGFVNVGVLHIYMFGFFCQFLMVVLFWSGESAKCSPYIMHAVCMLIPGFIFLCLAGWF